MSTLSAGQQNTYNYYFEGLIGPPGPPGPPGPAGIGPSLTTITSGIGVPGRLLDDGETPAAPTGLTATGGIQYNRLDWNANTETDLDHYEVYRNTINDSGTATRIAIAMTNVFVDGNLTGSQVQYYWVKAVDHLANKSDFSAGASATPRNAATGDIEDDAITALKIAVAGLDGTTGRIVVADATDADTITNGINAHATTLVEAGKILIAGSTVLSDWSHTNDLTFIDGGRIYTHSITADQIAANTITANEIAAATITANEMATGTITAASAIIADAAITSATIGELEVGTTKIADNATTSLISAYTGDSIGTYEFFWTTVQSLTITLSGSPVKLDFGLFPLVYAHYVRLTRNGTENSDVIWDYPDSHYAPANQFFAFHYIDSGEFGIDWTLQNSAADNDWQAIAYGAGLFVAVANTGSGNRVMTSPDGETWTIRTSIPNYGWLDVVYGDGASKFVAVSDNRSMVSTDGINWTSYSIGYNYVRAIAYGKGKFVAIREVHTAVDDVITSSDGITWTLRDTGGSYWNGITYGYNKFLAVGHGESGHRVAYSYNGIDWYLGDSAADNNWRDVAYGAGLFVAVGDGCVMTSPNGYTWTLRTPAAAYNWTSITYGGGKFVAVAESGTGQRVMTSANGIDWELQTTPADNSWTDVIYSTELPGYIAVADSGTGNRVMISLPTSSGATTYYLQAKAGDAFSGIAVQDRFLSAMEIKK